MGLFLVVGESETFVNLEMWHTSFRTILQAFSFEIHMIQFCFLIVKLENLNELIDFLIWCCYCCSLMLNYNNTHSTQAVVN